MNSNNCKLCPLSLNKKLMSDFEITPGIFGCFRALVALVCSMEGIDKIPETSDVSTWKEMDN